LSSNSRPHLRSTADSIGPCFVGSVGGPDRDAGRGGPACRSDSVGGPARDAGRGGSACRGGSGSSFKMMGALENRTEGRAFATGGEVSFGADFGRGGSWLEEVEPETFDVEGLPVVPRELRLDDMGPLGLFLVSTGAVVGSDFFVSSRTGC
jgi:hypothetical protein